MSVEHLIVADQISRTSFLLILLGPELGLPSLLMYLGRSSASLEITQEIK
uniref:Uncharacterized protein n=1 Tax=Arundo donax TaxID=35708 RepID=A0A0A8XWK5_ARUDO